MKDFKDVVTGVLLGESEETVLNEDANVKKIQDDVERKVPVLRGKLVASEGDEDEGYILSYALGTVFGLAVRNFDVTVYSNGKKHSMEIGFTDKAGKTTETDFNMNF